LASIKLDINTDGVVEHAARLERLHKSALPSAVRGTLNGMAFDVKKNTMPREASRAFTQRRPNFFKAMSRVETAKGFNLRSMEAVVGFIGADKYQAVEDLEKQEHGGTIGGRAFIPTKNARVSKSNARTVSRKNRISSFGRVVNVRNAKGKSKGEKFIKSVVHAGRGGIIIRGKAVFRVKSLKRVDSTRWKFKLELIYTYERGRSVRIRKATHFMRNASISSAEKGARIFQKEAERQIRRLS
jgi:hypothetical protein